MPADTVTAGKMSSMLCRDRSSHVPQRLVKVAKSAAPVHFVLGQAAASQQNYGRLEDGCHND